MMISAMRRMVCSRLLVMGRFRVLFIVKGYHAGADILCFMGYAKRVQTVCVRGGRVDIEVLTRSDDPFEFYSVQSFDPEVLLPCAGNDIGDHLELGNARQNGLIGEMAGEPGRVMVDSHPCPDVTGGKHL
jgi:hypothetical protein